MVLYRNLRNAAHLFDDRQPQNSTNNFILDPSDGQTKKKVPPAGKREYMRMFQ
jgi:hypothetical protein